VGLANAGGGYRSLYATEGPIGSPTYPYLKKREGERSYALLLRIFKKREGKRSYAIGTLALATLLLRIVKPSAPFEIEATGSKVG